MGLLAELLLDPDGQVRMDAITNIEYIPTDAVIRFIETSIQDERKQEPLKHLFWILSMYLDGTLPAINGNEFELVEDEWDISYAPEKLLEIATHFRTEIENMPSEGGRKGE